MVPPFSTPETVDLLIGILDGSPNGIVAYQPIRNDAGQTIDYQTVYYNAQAQKLLGYSEAEFSQQTLFERFPEGRTYEAQYLTMVQQNQPFIYESFFKRAQCWLEIQARRLGDGFFLLLRDITDRKRTEASLIQQNQLLDGIINTFLSGITAFEALTNDSGEVVDFRVALVNDGSIRLSGGHARDYMLGKTVTELFPQAQEQGMLSQYVTVYKTGQPIRTSHFYPVPQKWIDLSIQKTSNGLLVTYNDITEQKQAQLDLARQSDRLTAIFESSLNGIIAMQAIRDNDGQPIDFLMEAANGATLAMTGRTPAEIVGTTLLTTFPGNDEAGFLALYQRVVTSGQPEQTTQYYRDENGLEAWFEVSAVRQGTERIVVTFSDVTAAQQIQQQLRESNQSLEQFAGVASHDLQEPLRKVQAYGHILVQQFGSQLGASGQDMIHRMQRAAERMSTLIQDLLAYSRLTSQPELTSSLDMNVLVADVLTDLETRIVDQKAVVDVATLPTLPGNALTIRQLMQNLIGNALKFSRPGIPPHVQVRAERMRSDAVPIPLPTPRARAYWAIQVTDNGIGFDDRYKEQIFGAFQRLHNRNSAYSGTGIGLAIVKKVVEQHHGAIDVQSKVDEGSTFTIYLPA